MKMWEIRENDEHRPRKLRNYKEYDDYTCGYEDGYEEAMRSMQYRYNERKIY